MNFNFLHKKYTEYYIAATVLIIMIVTNFFYIIFTEPITPAETEFKVRRGAHLQEISNMLWEKGIIDNEHFFQLLTKMKSRQTKMRAGFYNISGIKTYNQLINLLCKGQNLSTKITIPEGSTIREIASIAMSEIFIDSARFVQLCNDSAFISELGFTVHSLEGYLFPDTYFFYKNDTEEIIIKKLVNNFKNKWAQAKEIIPMNYGKSQHEILTLASLIEGECIIDAERPTVSSLYQNRIKRRMKLEADPTIQYIIEDAPRRLLYKDLEIDSPYNTYKYPGLPPGPVNNPGLKSILAAIEPAQTNYLYMVAQGDGSHYFTRSYTAFLNAKRRFQKIRKQTKEQS